VAFFPKEINIDSNFCSYLSLKLCIYIYYDIIRIQI